MARVARRAFTQWMTRWDRVATPTLSAMIAAPLLVLSTVIASVATHRLALAVLVPLLAATVGAWLTHVAYAARSRRAALGPLQQALLRSLRDEDGSHAAEFAALAHDLRSPLLTLRGYFELLGEGMAGPLTAEAEALARRGARVAQDATATVDHALRGGPVAVGDRRPVALNDLLADVVSALDAPIARSGAQITISALPVVLSDADALRRVFLNLLENAIKYAGDVTPRVHISAYRRGNQQHILVRDWGRGLGDGESEALFTSGARGANATAADGGLGLGLHTVRQSVERLGGRVALDRRSPGVCAHITLPAGADSAASAAAAMPRTSAVIDEQSSVA